jgi:regulatory protein
MRPSRCRPRWTSDAVVKAPTSDDDARPPATAAGPARVARFDDLEALSADPDAGSGARRVARFDGLAEQAGAETRVSALDGLDGGRSDPATVAALDGDLGRSGATRSRRSAQPAPPGARPRVGRTSKDGPTDTTHRSPEPVSGDATTPGATRPADPVPTDGEVPPDAPLPRGRRRGGRGRKSGPDVPYPEQSDPAADPVAVAREICLRLLTDRARTRQELAQALTPKGVPDDAAAAVLDRFDEVGLIDDAAFAGQWVRSRHAHRGLGRRAIAVELRRKGVADDVAGEALAEVDAESEDRRARELVDRKLRSLTVATAEQRATAGRRLVGMLARKGYGAGTAYRVVREALAQHGGEVDELGADTLDE